MQQRRRVAKWRLRLSNRPIVRSFHSVYGRVPQNYDGCGCRISFRVRLVSVSVSVSVAAFDRSTRADSFVLLSPVVVAVVVVLLLVVAVVYYCSCCCCCCCHWAMLSIIDDAALAFEFLFLPFFLLTAFFLALAMEVSWSHWLHTILHISRLYTGLFKTLIHTQTHIHTHIMFVLCALQQISTCLIASATVYIHALWLMIAKSDSWTDTRTVVNYIVWTFNSMKPISRHSSSTDFLNVCFKLNNIPFGKRNILWNLFSARFDCH